MNFRSLLFKTITVLAVSSGIFSVAQAQRKAPGYMGRRFLLKYDQGISWSLGGDARGIPNLFYTLQGDLAVTTKWSVGAEYSFMTRKYQKRLGEATGYTYYLPSTYPYYRLDRTMMHRATVYGKLFSQRNGHLAPAGPYFLVGLDLYFVQGKFTKFASSSYSGLRRNEDRLSFDFGPVIGGGKQYVIANRMVISVDLRIRLPLIGLARTINDNVGIGTGSEIGKDAVINRSLDRWTLWPNTQANFIELRMGLGTLL